MAPESQPHCREEILDRHRNRADGGRTRPLYTEDQKVIGVGNSAGVVLSSYVKQTHDVSKGDEIRIETYAEGVFITTGGGADE